MARRPLASPVDPRVVELSRRMRELAREVAGPRASFADFEGVVEATRGEVVAEALREERAASAPSVPASRATRAKPRRRRLRATSGSLFANDPSRTVRACARQQRPDDPRHLQADPRSGAQTRRRERILRGLRGDDAGDLARATASRCWTSSTRSRAPSATPSRSTARPTCVTSRGTSPTTRCAAH